MNMTLNQVFSPNMFIQCRVFGGEQYLSINGQVFSLNEVGGFIWDCIDGENTIEQIIEKVADKFQASKEDVNSDVNEFVNDLLVKKLIEVE
jgi:methyltransferase-like protein